MDRQYKISSELFLYLLSNLPDPNMSTSFYSPGSYKVVFDDEVLLTKEVTSWMNVIREGPPLVTNKINIGPFYGVFPNSLEFAETSLSRMATAGFSIDYYDVSKSVTWKDWFMLEEDKGGQLEDEKSI